MLKAELIRARLVMQGDQVSTRPLPVDYHYLIVAGELAALFQTHGCTRLFLSRRMQGKPTTKVIASNSTGRSCRSSSLPSAMAFNLPNSCPR